MAITSVMDRDHVAEAYGRWAPIYDIVFGPVFRRGRRAAVRAAEHVGGHILEVGVGTGLSLADYGRGTRIVGIDISEPMLDKARKRVEAQGLTNVEALEVMDAEHLAMPDASFDVVVAQYVVTAIHNPERALDEFVRVVRPGGEIILTTRIGAETGLAKLWRNGSCPSPAASAGAPNSPGLVTNNGPPDRGPSAWWSGARCLRSVISGCCVTSAWPIRVPDPPLPSSDREPARNVDVQLSRDPEGTKVG